MCLLCSLFSDLMFSKRCTRKRRANEKVGTSDTKENWYISAEEAHFYRRNVKGILCI